MLSVDDARRLAATWRSRFPDEAEFEVSWTRYMDSATVPDEGRLEAWLAKDLAKYEVKHAGIVTEPLLPTRQNLPTEQVDRAELRAIELGDMHDFRDPLLSPEQHAAICIRCQIGVRSRQLADEHAAARGKTPFPGLSMEQFADKTIRCDECGQPEDHLAPETCQKSFWHLPDIWLALHPDAALADMGTLGPFMRGFLRRQRPA